MFGVKCDGLNEELFFTTSLRDKLIMIYAKRCYNEFDPKNEPIYIQCNERGELTSSLDKQVKFEK